MELRFSAHARQRMAERLIDEAEVVEVLAAPTATNVAEDLSRIAEIVGWRSPKM
jgi:hypothetical protein